MEEAKAFLECHLNATVDTVPYGRVYSGFAHSNRASLAIESHHSLGNLTRSCLEHDNNFGDCMSAVMGQRGKDWWQSSKHRWRGRLAEDLEQNIDVVLCQFPGYQARQSLV